MVDYKSKYLEMKLKYINGKNKFKGGVLPSVYSALDKAVRRRERRREIAKLKKWRENLKEKEAPPNYSVDHKYVQPNNSPPPPNYHPFE